LNQMAANKDITLVLYIHPIKQGLKRFKDLKWNHYIFFVLYIHPIKQGLKLRVSIIWNEKKESSLHTSNKTRIETLRYARRF